MSAHLSARNLGVRLGGREVLSAVNVDVNPACVLGILGPNGAGKSTLLRALAGLIPCDGELELGGARLASLDRKTIARAVALVPQDPPSDVPFTAAEVVLMGRSPHQGLWGIDSAADREQVARALQAMDVSDLAGRPIDALSGGERRRVFVARALAQGARTLMLDEPTAFLDLGHQLDLLRRCRGLASEGYAVVVVLHDPNLAAAFCDSVLVLERGRVCGFGPPMEALTREVLKTVFGVDVVTLVHPETGAPVFVPS